MPTKKIIDLAKIRTGLVISRKATDYQNLSNNKYPKYKVLSLKSVMNNTIDCNYFNEIYTNVEVETKYLTKENDVIVRLVNPLKSFVVTKDFVNVIVPSQFIKITDIDNNVLPQYLSIYLNYVYNLHKIKKEDTWLVNSIKLSAIGNIDIPIIDLKKQQEIIKFYQLYNLEINLYKNLIEKKEQLNNGILQNLINIK